VGNELTTDETHAADDEADGRAKPPPTNRASSRARSATNPPHRPKPPPASPRSAVSARASEGQTASVDALPQRAAGGRHGYHRVPRVVCASPSKRDSGADCEPYGLPPATAAGYDRPEPKQPQ
jgi:hypothetical protein